ncbi:PREDICTED: polygalacturonase inhibitor-like [Nelumbo nucifera]|uniref:Polygalacturonase inhibitor-like n=1 Tax=Nelumbo nucifera TaxID=4432 RepID=A0A1U8A7F8_NELNU|nr:PREDICTED: polygalacturonase inhibitor-like [Nelumbo nucifera]
MDTHSSASTSSLLSLLLLTLLLVLGSLPSPTLSTSERCHPDDKRALLNIKKAVTIPDHLASWNASNDCCYWDYVECHTETNRIYRLLMYDTSIHRPIPPSVGDLPYLEALVFNNINNLTGPIPYSITKLQNLKMLSIIWTPLSGRIPDFLGQLKSLEYLDLSHNQFSGSIPASLANLQNLTGIQLAANRLSGSIPDSFGRFKDNLYVFVLSRNMLSGKIPKSLSQLDCDSIDLSHNKLVGDASMLFRENSTVRGLDLSFNRLDFDLSNVKFPKNLTFLDLSHNRIRGSIPQQVTELDLWRMDFSYNRLCGRIPVGGKLQQFSYESFIQNRCLCGTPLSDCR